MFCLNFKGKKRAKEIKAKAYLECSAKDIVSVNEVFAAAIRVIMDPLKDYKKMVAKLAKKEEAEEKKMEKKLEKERKKLEAMELKKSEKEEK